MSFRKQPLQNLPASALNVGTTLAALVVHPVDESGAFVSPGAGSTQVSVKEILTSSGASVMDSTNNSIGVTIRAGSAAGTEYTDGDTDASVSGTAILFDNSSNTLRPVTIARGLPVNVVAGSAASTTVNVSSVGGAVVVRSSAADFKASIYQSTAADLNVTVAGYSTTVNVSSVGGAVVVRSSAADFKASIYQSTAADLNVTVAGYSTTANVSSVGGVVRIAGNNAADGIVHVGDSTNAALRVNVVAGSAASTTVNVSSLAGAVIVRSSAANFLASVYQSTAADLNVTVAGYSTTGNVSSLAGRVAIAGFHAIDGITNVTDSTNTALRVNVVAGAAGGSTEVTVRQSTYADFNTLSRLADRDQSTQVANITNTTPASTAYALAVREVVAQSTGPFHVSSIAGPVTVRSSAANLLASVYQSTAADLNVTVAGYSTTVNISSLAGPVIVRSTANSLLASVYQSTAADLNVTVAGYSTTVNVSSGVIRAQAYTSSGGAIEGSTTAPAVGVTGLHIRQVYPTMLSTTVLVTSTHSTAIYALVSSAASPLRHKVYAYFVGSTHTIGSTLIFCSSGSGSGLDHWHVHFGSGSSGMTGANMAVDPPGFIFGGVANNALNVKIEGGSSATSTVIARISIAYFTEA